MIDYSTAEKKMSSAITVLKDELSGLRSGRASAKMLEHITVDCYGAKTPLQQCGSISVPEPRQLTVSVWDKSLIKAVEKAITDSGLGLTPQTDGNLIRLRLPELTEERRMELIKLAHKYAETAKISVRNLRRDLMDFIKNQEKQKTIGEDDAKKQSEHAQKLTDRFISEIDKILSDKEKDIKHI